MTSLPQTLVRFRTDLEEAIAREQASRLRPGRRRRRIAVLVAAAVVVIVGTATAVAIVRDVFFVEPFAEGRISRTVEGVRFSLSVPRTRRTSLGPTGWENGPHERVGGNFRTRSLLISKSLVGGQAAEAVVFWTGFRDRTEAAPCERLLGSAIRQPTAAIAAALARAPGTKLVTGPTRVTLDGLPAQHVVLRVRRDRGCDPGYFFTWRNPWLGAFWPGTNVGDTIKVWIVDVHGTRLFFEDEIRNLAMYPAAVRAELEPEIAQIVRSIRFD